MLYYPNCWKRRLRRNRNFKFPRTNTKRWRLFKKSLAYIVPKACFDELLVLWRQYSLESKMNLADDNAWGLIKVKEFILSSIGKQTPTSKFNQTLSLFCSYKKPDLKFFEMFIGSSDYYKYTRTRKKFRGCEYKIIYQTIRMCLTLACPISQVVQL